MFVESQKVHI